MPQLNNPLWWIVTGFIAVIATFAGLIVATICGLLPWWPVVAAGVAVVLYGAMVIWIVGQFAE